MEYLIAGIRIDIPHRFTTGAFGMALAPFAAGSKTETDAGSNRMGMGPQLQHLRPEAGGGHLPERPPQLQAEH